MPTKSEETLTQLKEGIREFQQNIYPARKTDYEYAATHPQKPHTLLITCADSRIDPEAITSSPPGSIFVARNVGNMVPAYGEMLGGVSAVIEYAIDALGVSHAVVCGHTDCGAMKGVLAITEEPLVSIDFNHIAASSTAALPQTQVIEGQLARVLSWYDNEWGFSTRMADTALAMAKFL